MTERLHVIVEGTVQGVGFRAFVIDQARKLAVTGWVRNRWDNSVEVCAEGERSILEGFLEVFKARSCGSECARSTCRMAICQRRVHGFSDAVFSLIFEGSLCRSNFWVISIILFSSGRQIVAFSLDLADVQFWKANEQMDVPACGNYS